jgi:hypothetical protein
LYAQPKDITRKTTPKRTKNEVNRKVTREFCTRVNGIPKIIPRLLIILKITVIPNVIQKYLLVKLRPFLKLFVTEVSNSKNKAGKKKATKRFKRKPINVKAEVKNREITGIIKLDHNALKEYSSGEYEEYNNSPKIELNNSSSRTSRNVIPNTNNWSIKTLGNSFIAITALETGFIAVLFSHIIGLREARVQLRIKQVSKKSNIIDIASKSKADWFNVSKSKSTRKLVIDSKNDEYPYPINEKNISARIPRQMIRGKIL